MNILDRFLYLFEAEDVGEVGHVDPVDGRGFHSDARIRILNFTNLAINLLFKLLGLLFFNLSVFQHFINLMLLLDKKEI